MSGELEGIAPSSEELAGAELAARAGVGEEEIQRLVSHGVLVPRQGRVAPFRAVDVLKIRLARACEEGGLPMEGMAKAIRAGHLSFAFVESWPFERWAARGPRTHAELAEEVGLPVESLQRIVEAFGFARPEPGDAVVEAERPVAWLVGRAVEVGLVDEAASVRFGNVYAEALRRIAAVEVEVYHSGIEMPLLRSGLGARRTMELAEEVTEEVTGGACGQARRHPAARPTPASWGGGEVAGGWGHVPLPGPVGGRWCRLWTWWRTSRPRACRPPALGWLPGLTSPIRLFQARRS